MLVPSQPINTPYQGCLPVFTKQHHHYKHHCKDKGVWAVTKEATYSPTMLIMGLMTYMRHYVSKHLCACVHATRNPVYTTATSQIPACLLVRTPHPACLL